MELRPPEGRARGEQVRVGEIIAGRRAVTGPYRPGRSLGTADERDLVTSYLHGWAVSELGDEAPLSSTVTRVMTILKRTDLPMERWPDLLYRARAITKEHSARITKRPAHGRTSPVAKNRMPYFLAVLEDVVGLRGKSTHPA
jgi:hypothetical protein